MDETFLDNAYDRYRCYNCCSILYRSSRERTAKVNQQQFKSKKQQEQHFLHDSDDDKSPSVSSKKSKKSDDRDASLPSSLRSVDSKKEGSLPKKIVSGNARACFCDGILERYAHTDVPQKYNLAEAKCMFCTSDLTNSEVVWICPQQCSGKTFICEHCSQQEHCTILGCGGVLNEVFAQDIPNCLTDTSIHCEICDYDWVGTWKFSKIYICQTCDLMICKPCKDSCLSSKQYRFGRKRRRRAFGRADENSLETDSCRGCTEDLTPTAFELSSNKQNCAGCQEEFKFDQQVYECTEFGCSLRYQKFCKYCVRNVCVSIGCEAGEAPQKLSNTKRLHEGSDQRGYCYICRTQITSKLIEPYIYKCRTCKTMYCEYCAIHLTYNQKDQWQTDTNPLLKNFTVQYDDGSWDSRLIIDNDRVGFTLKAGMKVFFRKRKVKENESVWFEATIIKIKIPEASSDPSDWANTCVTWLPAGGCIMNEGNHIWLEKNETSESYTWQESLFIPSSVDVTCDTVQDEDGEWHVLEQIVLNSYRQILPDKRKSRKKK